MHKTGLRFLWIAVLMVALDRVTKQLAIAYLTPYSPLFVSSFFNLTLSYNKGAAFSILDHAAGWQGVFLGGIAMVVILAIVMTLSRLSFRRMWLNVALNFVMGGAIGNLWDRLTQGVVTDFIQWHVADWYWPVFNIADSAICVGAVMILWDALRVKKSKD